MKTVFSIIVACLLANQILLAQELGNPAQKRKGAPQQPAQTCATDEVTQNMFRQYPATMHLHESMERAYRQKIQELGNSAYERMGGDPILTIPVVVHIVHRTGIPVGTEENLTDADIISVINGVNDRYAHSSGTAYSNPYSGVNIGVELCLAQRDPSGNFTTGIVRHADNTLAENDITTYNTQLGYYWNTTQYMNIYITHSISGGGTSGVAGYSTLASSHGNNGDGVVIVYSAWWSGLLAHESGHYFNLEHNFQGGCPNNNCLTNGDKVCDTPPKNSAGGAGAGCSPSNSCNTDDDDLSTNNPFRPVASGGLGDVTDSNENYMDYSGGCWGAYTVGQKQRMRLAITTTRASLLANNYCFFTNNDAGITGVTSPSASVCQATVTPVVTLRNFGGATLTSVSIIAVVNTAWQYTHTWTGSLPTDGTTNVTLPDLTLASGANTLVFFTLDPNSSPDGYTANDTFIFEVNYGGTPPPISQNFEGAFVPAQWSLTNPDGATTWQQASSTCNANSAYINNYSYNAPGNLDHLLSPLVSLVGYSGATLTFDVAYAPFTGYTDGLLVSVSTNCGATFTEVYNKSGLTLATAPAIGSSFIPADCSQWRTETVNLNAYAGSQILLRFTNVNGYGNNLYLDNVNLSGVVATGIRVQAKVFLEGAYNPATGAMTNTLSANGLLPATQPYSGAPWNYGGTETTASVPATLTDWVLLELLNGSLNMVAQRAAFVRTDGQLTDTDGTTGVLFPAGVVTAGSAYTLRIRHRNHLGVLSAVPLTIPNASAYDFTNNANVKGTGQVQQVAAGVYALWAGDCQTNGVITYTDFNKYFTQSGTSAYIATDLNLDGTVNSADFTLYRNNAGRIALPEAR
ncbi:hypothetical protein C7N43_30135 [Sphingobacteriales bacterium UPWRP_1]|nr:hypothetical protein BVG80_18615 [Sphingobacteriales bacterium TSM_CSM]PSJ73235.1 hypothetical protein C7N43_30135 [Sphingobacteriales bacterium UPWRP_1]